MTKVHFTHTYLLNPTHPITVNLIGCGGTGSQVLTSLARMNAALIGLEHPGLYVTAFDGDIVTESNQGRQLFSSADIGTNKAVVLISRLNRFFGTAWEAAPQLYNNEPANIIITCVDNVKSRIDVGKMLKKKNDNNATDPYQSTLYWLDFGNTQNTGQVILGTFGKIQQPKSEKFETVSKLKCITEQFDLSKVNDEDSGPSCSLAEALSKQDLFINSTLANLGCNILWKMIREGFIEYPGLYLNLATMKVNPITL